MKLLSFIFLAQSAFAQTMMFTFDDLKIGAQLSGWEQGFYGPKGDPRWQIEKDLTAPSSPLVLKQAGQAIYSWLVKTEPLIKDGVIEADMKVISGKEDPEVGLVWKHLDGKNYYYTRINALENNVIFYRMNQGKKELVKEAEAKVGFQTWHHIKVVFKGDQVDILFDQKPVVSVRDSVMKEAGHVGFFTTADTVGAFDNFKIETETKKVVK